MSVRTGLPACAGNDDKSRCGLNLMIVLGIETTCDETAAAVVERRPDGRGEILSNIVFSQIADHAAFGGVVPEIAARAHVEILDLLVSRAMREAGCGFDDLDGIAAAAGPGLIGGVIVGLTTAKAIALVREKPLIAVNHLEAHALTPRLVDDVPFPYCLFLASGGVAANQAIRKMLHRLAFEAATILVVPPTELCTDNGAMIAWAGAERLALGLTDTLDTAPLARWPLSEVKSRYVPPAAVKKPS